MTNQNVIERFLKSAKYLKMKAEEEKTHFKLFGSYCRIKADGMVDVVSASTMKEHYKNKKISCKISTTNNEGCVQEKIISKNFFDVWSEDPEMTEFLDLTFECDLKRVPRTHYNLFTGFDHLNSFESKDNLDLTMILDHLNALSGYNEDDFKYNLSWYAHIVQKPEELPHSCLVFIGPQGTGKDTWHQFISAVIGDQYCAISEKLEKFCGKFNGAVANKLLCTINETNPVESRERLESIKSMITAEEHLIEYKGRDPIKCRAFSRFQFFANRLTAFPVEEGGRRPKFNQPSAKYTPQVIGETASRKHFTILRKIMNDPRHQKRFLEYLQNYDIKKWNPAKIPKCELQKELEDNAQPPIVPFLAKKVVNMENETEKINASKLYEEFATFLEKQKSSFNYSQTKFATELTMNYGVKKQKSSTIFYILSRSSLKELLEKRYNYSFDSIETDQQIDNKVDSETVNKLKQEMAELKAQQTLKDNEIEKLKQELAKIKEQSIMSDMHMMSVIQKQSKLLQENKKPVFVKSTAAKSEKKIANITVEHEIKTVEHDIKTAEHEIEKDHPIQEVDDHDEVDNNEDISVQIKENVQLFFK